MSTWRAGRLGFEGLAFAPDRCSRRDGARRTLRPVGTRFGLLRIQSAFHIAQRVYSAVERTCTNSYCYSRSALQLCL